MKFLNSTTISFFLMYYGGNTTAFSARPSFLSKPYSSVTSGVASGVTSGVTSSITSSITNIRATKANDLRLHQSSQDNNESSSKSSLDVMMGKVDIPDEYKEEIFKAEANTPAAKDRSTRTAIYACIALLGIGISSFNAFLTNIRDGAGTAADLSAINELGFGWVGENPFTSFLFLNKIGGGLALLSAGLGGTMVELEVSLDFCIVKWTERDFD